MRPLIEFPLAERVRGVLCDLDDTLTTRGRLTASAYSAMERLQRAGILVIAITGRPAGWCDHIARMWPVDGVVGENGAFYFRYDHDRNAMQRHYMDDPATRVQNRARLMQIGARIIAAVPGAKLSADQHYRETDLAVDYCEDVPPLAPEAVETIVTLMLNEGLTAKVSSIHVNGWFGGYDKLAMTKILMRACFNIDLDACKDDFVFAGDSPNDAPLFAFFPGAVGVANIRNFAGRLAAEPAYVTQAECGAGFLELADFLLAAR